MGGEVGHGAPPAGRTRWASTVERGTLTFILAGGRGERLYPLTRDRAKPAVPFGGIYRIIDFTLSNCVNSNLRRVNVLTQYKAVSLDRHIRYGWNMFSGQLGEFINIIPAQQRTGSNWYLGTADAIYQNIYSIDREGADRVLILAGDHIYMMDYLEMLTYHEERKADLTVGAVEAPLEERASLGVLSVDEGGHITGFHEKSSEAPPVPGKPDTVLASMGIYVFNTDALKRRVKEDAEMETSHDFGRDVIPRMVAEGDGVYVFNFNDKRTGEPRYWRDIGTLDAYFEANMDLVSVEPTFNLYDAEWPIRTYQGQYPPAKSVFSDAWGRRGEAIDSLVSAGCIISGGLVERSILSPNVRIESHAHVCDSIIFNEVIVGQGAKVRGAIVDKETIIKPGAEVGYDMERDRQRFTVTDLGVIVIAKESIVE
jgi:glucose-1-phosphate adenylyltransferase